jgi:AcrR family transcriptional regulator
VYQPNSADIAQRAGISPRSLFRYFDDVDDLHRAAIERQLADAAPLLKLGASPEDPTAAKVDCLVEARARLFEAIAPAARAGRASAHRHPVVAAQVHESRAYLRNQVKRLFAPELRHDAALLPALDALSSFEAYELLRFDQGLSRARATAALTTALMKLLT